MVEGQEGGGSRGARVPRPLGQQLCSGQPAPGPLSPGRVGPGPRCAGAAARTEREGPAVPLRGGRRGPGVVLVLRRVGASAAEPGLSRGRFASSQPTANSRRWLGGDGGGRWVSTELSAARPFGGAGPTRPDHGVPASASSSALEERDTEAAQPGERGRGGPCSPEGRGWTPRGGGAGGSPQSLGPALSALLGPPVRESSGPPRPGAPVQQQQLGLSASLSCPWGRLDPRPQEEPVTGAGCRSHSGGLTPRASVLPGIYTAHMWVGATCLP